MKKNLAILASVFTIYSFSQTQKDSTQSIKLNEIIVSSQRYAKNKKNISQQIESISKKEIEFGNFQNTADVFQNSGLLAVQKSQQGGGSPVIRGFEASRILLIVDGIRMNNLIYRTGHLQNSITIDKNMLENTDVLFGPSSTIYGSDALGGAIYFKTKEAKTLNNTNNKILTGALITSYNSVNQGKMSHFNLNYAHKNWASLTAFSFNDYGDLKMGQNTNGSNPPFGERPFYIQTTNNIDTQVANDNRFVQKFTAYKQYDFMQKLQYNQASGYKHALNLQYSTTTDIPRYDRLTDVNNAGNLKTAIWNYGPQKRLLTAYTLDKNNIFLHSDMKITLSYQKIEESRITRNVNNNNLNSRIEKVAIFGFNSDFKTKIGQADFIYGVDVYTDQLNSTANKTNILTNATSVLDTRYPDGKNNTLSIETFASYNNSFNKQTAYNLGFRAGYKELNSDIATNFLNLPFTAVNQKNITYSGAAGLTYNPSQKVKLAFNLASAFRVPNIEDLTKIFETTAGTIIVPNNNLKPEKTLTADLGITLWVGKTFQFENSFFITKMYDPIVTDTFSLNGQTTLLYAGTNSTILANQNQGQANIMGLSSIVKTYLSKNLIFSATVNIIKGTVENNYRTSPLDHIAPVYGKIGLKYENTKLNIDLYMLYNGAKKLTSYSPSGEDNLIYAPAGGTPSWETYNLKASYNFHPITVFAGIENALDIQYRAFASGINAPGRNTYLGAKFSF
jgi:hemoglobin/transferrin/lactoferrin receptor protein